MNLNIYVTDPFGNTLPDGSLNDFISLDFGQSEMEVGKLSIKLSYTHAPHKFAWHNRIYIWEDGVLAGETFWLIDRVESETDSNGGSVWVVQATDVNVLFTHRNALDYSGTPRTDKIGEAGQLMVEIMREAFGVDALGGLLATNPARDISQFLDIAPCNVTTPIVYKAFAYQEIYSTLVKIAQDAIERGTYVSFGIVAKSVNKLEFRVYVGQRGVDRRDQITLTSDSENLSSVQYTENYSDVATAVLAAGQGEEILRETAYVVDQARVEKSPFGYIEAFRDARHIADPDKLITEANTRLNEGQPVISAKADVQERYDAVFGVHFGFGDYVTVKVDEKLFEARVKAYNVSIAEGNRTVQIALEGTPRATRPLGVLDGIQYLGMMEIPFGAAARPSLPSGFSISVTGTGNTGFYLQWTDNSLTETGFEIEYSTDGSIYAPLATTGTNVTAYTHSTPTLGAGIHYYRLRSINGIVASDWVYAQRKGLILYVKASYECDETSGTRADTLGAYPLTVEVGGAGALTGLFGNAIDGSANVRLRNDSYAMTSATPFAISCWVRWTSSTGAGNWLIALYPNATGERFGIITNGSNVNIEQQNGTGVSLGLTTNVWSLVVFGFDGTNTVYSVNGGAKTTLFSGAWGTDWSRLWVGSENTNSVYRVDQINWHYGRFLGNEELVLLYNAGTGIQYPFL